MTKLKHTSPAFLQKTLSQEKKSFVRSHLPDFLKAARTEYRNKLPSSKELLYEFIEYLGKFDKAFHGLIKTQLSTGYKGVQQIYDTVRKNAKPLDEKQLHELAPSGKASAAKKHVIDTPPKNQEIGLLKKAVTPGKLIPKRDTLLEEAEKNAES